MKKTVILIFGITAVVTAVLLWWFSDTQVVTRQTKELAGVLNIAQDDGKTARASKNQNLGTLLAKSASCHIDIAEYQSDFLRDDLIAAHHMVVQSCRSAKAEASKMEITELSDIEATVTADIALSITEKNGTTHSESCQAVLTWQKDDQGKWKLGGIELSSP